jgi:hypothetical protein
MTGGAGFIVDGGKDEESINDFGLGGCNDKE